MKERFGEIFPASVVLASFIASSRLESPSTIIDSSDESRSSSSLSSLQTTISSAVNKDLRDELSLSSFSGTGIPRSFGLQRVWLLLRVRLLLRLRLASLLLGDRLASLLLEFLPCCRRLDLSMSSRLMAFLQICSTPSLSAPLRFIAFSSATP